MPIGDDWARVRNSCSLVRSASTASLRQRMSRMLMTRPPMPPLSSRIEPPAISTGTQVPSACDARTAMGLTESMRSSALPSRSTAASTSSGWMKSHAGRPIMSSASRPSISWTAVEIQVIVPSTSIVPMTSGLASTRFSNARLGRRRRRGARLMSVKPLTMPPTSGSSKQVDLHELEPPVGAVAVRARASTIERRPGSAEQVAPVAEEHRLVGRVDRGRAAPGPCTAPACSRAPARPRRSRRAPGRRRRAGSRHRPARGPAAPPLARDSGSPP